MKNSSDLLQPTTPPRTPPTAGRRRRRTYIKKYHETHEIPALNRCSLPSEFFVAGKLVKAGLRWITQRYTAQLRPDERSFIHAERSVAPRRRRNNSKGNKENENSREKKVRAMFPDEPSFKLTVLSGTATFAIRRASPSTAKSNMKSLTCTVTALSKR